MRVSYLVALLASVAAASPLVDELVKRADLSATVLSDLKAEDAAGKKVNDTFNAFGDNDVPTSKQESNALAANDKLNTAIKKTTSDANNSGTFSSTGSSNIATYVKGPLTADVISILNNIEAHYPGVKKGSLDQVVESNLKSQLKLVQAQGTAITAKLVEPYKSQAPAVLKVITDKYNEAIAKYA